MLVRNQFAVSDVVLKKQKQKIKNFVKICEIEFKDKSLYILSFYFLKSLIFKKSYFPVRREPY